MLACRALDWAAVHKNVFALGCPASGWAAPHRNMFGMGYPFGGWHALPSCRATLLWAGLPCTCLCGPCFGPGCPAQEYVWDGLPCFGPGLPALNSECSKLTVISLQKQSSVNLTLVGGTAPKGFICSGAPKGRRNIYKYILNRESIKGGRESIVSQ